MVSGAFDSVSGGGETIRVRTCGRWSYYIFFSEFMARTLVIDSSGVVFYRPIFGDEATKVKLEES